MVQQMHTAELRAKIKNLLAPEGLCHSELQVDASGERIACARQERGNLHVHVQQIFGLRNPSPSCMTLPHVIPQPCNKITLNSFSFQ